MLKILMITMIAALHVNPVQDLNMVRSNYARALEDKKVCSEMIKELKPVEGNDVYLAWLGGYQTIWANHVFNPLSKLKTFNEGKKNIEKAVNNDPQNPEIRLVRLSVQKNAPSFLKYQGDIEEDEAFIRKNISAITHPVLLKMANELLKR
ncbi:MAG: hypothetical protein ACTHJ5_01075 [Ilyomonas sp.]